MRLICPNCGAQYEVDASVIPETGRDVQCSNCGTTWFQQPPGLDNDLAEELGFEVVENAAPTSDEAESDIPDFGTPDEEPQIQPEMTQGDPLIQEDADPIESAVAGLAAEFDSQDADEEDPFNASDADSTFDEPMDGVEDPEKVMPSRPTQRAAVSDSVRDILRAEVEFDQATRKPRAEALESQPDLGLDDADDVAHRQGLRERMARLRGLDPADAPTGLGAAIASGKRRDLLPDIEEINSTLSASSERNPDGSVAGDDVLKERARKSGFRSTFFGLIALALVLIGLYVFAPILAENVPALAGTLETYVAAANGFRSWLDGAVSGAIERLNELVGQLGQSDAEN